MIYRARIAFCGKIYPSRAEFAAYQIMTSLKYGSLKGSGVNSLHRSI